MYKKERERKQKMNEGSSNSKLNLIVLKLKKVDGGDENIYNFNSHQDTGM